MAVKNKDLAKGLAALGYKDKNLTESPAETYCKFKECAMGIKKETGEERQFGTGARKQHAEGKGTPVLVPGDAILDIAKHFEEGAAVYGPRNWEKGIPLSELLNSAERHLQQLKMGLTDEAHDRAFAWNAIVYLATKLRIAAGILPKELDDMPRYEEIKTVQDIEHSTLCDECEEKMKNAKQWEAVELCRECSERMV